MMEQAQTEQRAVMSAQTALAQMAARHRLAAAEQVATFDAGLRSAFARMANDWRGLGAQVRRVTQRAISVAEVADLIEPGMFVAILDGTGDSLGVALICPKLLAGLVEGVATGRVIAAPTAARQPTRTDAALLAPMIDVLLRQISERCQTLPLAQGVGGFVYGSFMQDTRPLSILLEDGQFRLFSFDVALGDNVVHGTWSLILPDVPLVSNMTSTGAISGEETLWGQQMESVVSNSPTQLDAVLFKAQLSLSTALSLSPGDMLCIPLGALEALTLRSLDGANLGTGRLGQARGQRALRLTCDLGPMSADTNPGLPKSASMTPVIRSIDAATDLAPQRSRTDP